jgi:hypothetical protein
MPNLEERKVKIILALSETNNGAGVGYICQKCGVDETCESPCKHLTHLEEDGFIERLPPSSWSPSLEPRYNLLDKTRKLLNIG